MVPFKRSASVGRPAKSYQQEFFSDTECSLENLSETMDDINERQMRVREIYVLYTHDNHNHNINTTVHIQIQTHNTNIQVLRHEVRDTILKSLS